MTTQPSPTAMSLDVLRHDKPGALTLSTAEEPPTLTFVSGDARSQFDLVAMRPSDVRLFEREIEVHHNGVHSFRIPDGAKRPDVVAFVEAVREASGSLEARKSRSRDKASSSTSALSAPRVTPPAEEPTVAKSEPAAARRGGLSGSTLVTSPPSTRQLPNPHMERAASFGGVVEGVALFFTAIGVVVGAIGMLWALGTDSLYGDTAARASLVAYFVVLILASILWFLPIAMIAAYIRGKAEQR